jgi:hypothetical protein
MNSDLEGDNVIDMDKQNEIVRLEDRMKTIETLLNTRFTIIEN